MEAWVNELEAVLLSAGRDMSESSTGLPKGFASALEGVGATAPWRTGRVLKYLSELVDVAADEPIAEARQKQLDKAQEAVGALVESVVAIWPCVPDDARADLLPAVKTLAKAAVEWSENSDPSDGIDKLEDSGGNLPGMIMKQLEEKAKPTPAEVAAELSSSVAAFAPEEERRGHQATTTALHQAQEEIRQYREVLQHLNGKPWDTSGPWVCEQHPDRIFPHDDCVGPGMRPVPTPPSPEKPSFRALLEAACDVFPREALDPDAEAPLAAALARLVAMAREIHTGSLLDQATRRPLHWMAALKP